MFQDYFGQKVTDPQQSSWKLKNEIDWLESLKANPDEKAVHLLIERIDVNQSEDKEKTDISIQSTLISVLGKDGGDRGARTHDLSDVNRTL